jgi:hypothetical protein
VAAVSKAPQTKKLPIRGFQGDQDPFLEAFTGQGEDAVKLALGNGYQKPTCIVAPGAGHRAFAQAVVDSFLWADASTPA